MSALTVTQAAAILQVSERTVYEQIRLGKIPALKIGGIWRINEEQMIEALTYTPGPSDSDPMPRPSRSTFDDELAKRREARRAA